MMSKHECRRPDTCVCDVQALEPYEFCPVHGSGEWPPRCKICGQFMEGEMMPKLGPEVPLGPLPPRTAEDYEKEIAELKSEIRNMKNGPYK